MMLKALANVFILTCFLFGASNEAKSMSFDKDDTVTVKPLENAASSNIVFDDYKDCNDEDCHDHDRHCAHHCSGVHNMVEPKQEVKLSYEIGIDSKITWYFDFHYDEPFLDPALKPPLFS